MKNKNILETVGANILWKEIKEEFLKEKEYWETNEEVNWIFGDESNLIKK